jgi:hypothetical protein
MPSTIVIPEYWRKRAHEARTIAEMLEDPAAKRMMLGVVEGSESPIE